MTTLDDLIHQTALENCPKGSPEEIQRCEDALRKMDQGYFLKDVMGLDPNSLEWIYSQAYRQFNSGHYQEALKTFESLCALDPKSAKYHKGMGACLHMRQEYFDAIGQYLYCAILDPENPHYLFHAADCYEKLHNNHLATLCLNGVIAAVQGKPEFLGMLEKALMMQDHLSKKIPHEKAEPPK